jgi:hypothetical protein
MNVAEWYSGASCWLLFVAVYVSLLERERERELYY